MTVTGRAMRIKTRRRELCQYVNYNIPLDEFRAVGANAIGAKSDGDSDFFRDSLRPAKSSLYQKPVPYRSRSYAPMDG